MSQNLIDVKKDILIEILIQRYLDTKLT